GYAVASEGSRRARVRLEELASGRRRATAATDVLTMQTARRFELLDHPSASGEHVVIGLDLSFRFYELGEDDVENPLALPPRADRRIRFECVPRDQIFRPARRTPKPRIHGVQ